MRNEIISIISEGLEDQGVLISILKAFGFDRSEIRLIRPGLSKDENDLHNDLQTIGTFQGVKNSCVGKNNKRPDFEKALFFHNCNTIVIQLNTAEIEEHDFPFIKPQKQGNLNYSTELREKVILLINSWLDNNYTDNILYAIAIEEIEAWCLTIFEEDTVNSANPKTKLHRYLNRNDLTYRKLKLNQSKHKCEYFETFTKKKGFHKIKKLKQFAEQNQSLDDFLISVKQRFN
ncbi:MAG: hypothetical protein U9N85_07340 [Bacteroidota bacterium]|nr:hypothetical protein [Bacteroidota bacterium]